MKASDRKKRFDGCEEWRSVPGFEGMYEASNLGRIRSLDRVLADGKRWKGRILNQHNNGNGYKYVTLGCGKKGQRKNAYVHRLVVEAFFGEAPEGHQTCHWNGDRTDNRVENLRWGTVSENLLDRRRHGTANSGERNPNAVLTEATVKALLSDISRGVSIEAAAKARGIRYLHACRIVRGERWGYLQRGDAA